MENIFFSASRIPPSPPQAIRLWLYENILNPGTKNREARTQIRGRNSRTQDPDVRTQNSAKYEMPYWFTQNPELRSRTLWFTCVPVVLRVYLGNGSFRGADMINPLPLSFPHSLPVPSMCAALSFLHDGTRRALRFPRQGLHCRDVTILVEGRLRCRHSGETCPR